jgi:hypothetical protein
MTLTTPAPESYTRFSCPNPHCAQCNRPGEGTIAHRSWTGTHRHIERRRCTACGREFSEREGPLRACSKLSEETVRRLVKCQRWGVCDAGAADICAVDLTTVHRLQRVAAQRAATPHRQSVQNVDVQGVQWDEAHSQLRPKQVEWGHTALAMGSWFLLWVDCGPRTQETAATLIAQVVARTRQLPLVLTEGWRAYTAALLQVVGGVHRRRRRGKVGRKPQPRLVAPPALLYAQGARSATRRARSWRSADAWSLVARAVLASSGACANSARRSRQPVWHAGMAPCAGLVAPLRRRTRCLSWSRARHRGKVWLVVSRYNCVMPPKSLRHGRTPRTPAMARGLTDHGWSYREYVWLPVHTDPVLIKQMDERIACLLPPALQDQPIGRIQEPTNTETRAKNEKEAAPLPKAA